MVAKFSIFNEHHKFVEKLMKLELGLCGNEVINSLTRTQSYEILNEIWKKKQSRRVDARTSLSWYIKMYTKSHLPFGGNES